MTTASIPADGWVLLDSSNYASNTVVALSISEAVVNDLKEITATSSTGVQFVTGKHPAIRYGKRSIDLIVTPERFVNEIYHSTNDANLTRYSTATYRARTIPVRVETDEALIALQRSLAQYDDQKKASQIHVANAVLPEPKNRWEAAKQSKKAGVLGITNGASPALSATRSPALAPTAAYHDPSSPKTKAIRHAVIHLLAMRSQSTEEIAAKVRIPVHEVKGVLQTLGQMVDGKWKLSDKVYKELDVWRFKYTKDEDRKAAIDNAIRAYDRQRMSKDDKLWQILLPKAERGKGKVLSRLHLGHGSQPRVASPLADGNVSSGIDSPRLPSQGTPTLNASKKSTVINRLLSKDPKKARAAEEAKDRKRKEREHTDSERAERPAKRPANSTTKKPSTNAKSAEFVFSSDDEELDGDKTSMDARPHAQESSQAKTNTHINTSEAAKKLPETDIKHKTTHGKQTPRPNNISEPSGRPKTHISPSKAIRATAPSPLGAARSRVASDISDRSGISQRRAGIETPRGLGITTTPRKRHDTVTSIESGGRSDLQTSTNGTYKPRPKDTERSSMSKPTSQLDPSDTGSSHRKTTSEQSNTQSSLGSTAQDMLDGGSSDSSTSMVDTITFSQGVDLATKFQNHYYPQYAKIYDSIAERQQKGDFVSSLETKKLWEMHVRLQQMKHEIIAASERQRGGES